MRTLVLVFCLLFSTVSFSDTLICNEWKFTQGNFKGIENNHNTPAIYSFEDSDGRKILFSFSNCFIIN